MGNYIYYWDSANKKKRYGGKRGAMTSEFSDKDAGTKRTMKRETAGTKREFKGSKSNEYTFYSPSKGTLVVTATSFEEAWRRAKALGYSRRNYRSK